MTAPSDGSVETPRPTRMPRAAGATALWRDIAGGTAADPGFVWALIVGVLLVALGLLGFVPNPIVGAPSAAWGTPLLLTGDAHDVLHLVAGAVALHAALGMSRSHRDAVLIGLGAAALILLALGLLDGRWFGIAPYHVGLADQLLHLIVGVGSLVMGLAGTGAITVPVVTGAYRRSELGLAGVAGAAAGTDPGSAAEPVPAARAVSPVDSEPAEAPAPAPAADDIAAAPEPAEAPVPAPADDDIAAAPEPAEAMPEPLGLDLEATEPAPVASVVPPAQTEPSADAEPEPATDPDPQPDPEIAAAPDVVTEPEPEPPKP